MKTLTHCLNSSTLLLILIFGTFGNQNVYAQSGVENVTGTPAVQEENASLLAQSQSLSVADQGRARQLFSTGFQLWQAGDFSAAELAFHEGLEIDPANSVANFYYGDCLKRKGQRVLAQTYYNRAIAFGPDAPEAFRARAALQELATPPSRLGEMSPDELSAALVGTWAFTYDGRRHRENQILHIQSVDGVRLVVEGSPGGVWHFEQGQIDGEEVVVLERTHMSVLGALYGESTGTLRARFSPGRMQGIEETTIGGDHYSSAFTMVKQ